MPEKIKSIARTTKFGSAGEAANWAYTMMGIQAKKRGLTIMRRNWHIEDDRLVAMGRIGDSIVAVVHFDVIETATSMAYRLAEFMLSGESLMPKIADEKPSKAKVFSRPRFENEEAAVKWAKRQIANIHRTFGVKPDAPAHWSVYFDKTIFAGSHVGGSPAVDIEFRPCMNQAGEVQSWTCTSVTVHL